MPSYRHEVLIEMFRDRPQLVADLLGGPLDIKIPRFDRALVSDADATVLAPTEYRADAVVTLHRAGNPVLAVVVEVQLSEVTEKRLSWPVYVVSQYAKPIVIGLPGLVLTPMVLGPRQVPLVTDPDQARRSPQLAVLSALIHGRRADPTPVFAALLAALDTVDHNHVALYTDLVLTALPAEAQARLEELMAITIPGYPQSNFARRHFSQGEAEALLTILDARGIEVPDDVRTEITDCTDLEQLNTWIRRAATAHKVQDLFD
jgi:hypothetical protein